MSGLGPVDMSAEKDDQGSKGFTVNDHRGAASEAAPSVDDQPARDAGAAPLPELDFATFVISLSTSALCYLGEIPHPETDRRETSLPLAKQTIDLLALLQDKTRGNLTTDEERLLTSLLYDLRMKYVEHAKP